MKLGIKTNLGWIVLLTWILLNSPVLTAKLVAAEVEVKVSSRFALVGLISSSDGEGGVAVVKDQKLNKTLVLNQGEYIDRSESLFLEKVDQEGVFLKDENSGEATIIGYSGATSHRNYGSSETFSEEVEMDDEDLAYYEDILSQKKKFDEARKNIRANIKPIK